MSVAMALYNQRVDIKGYSAPKEPSSHAACPVDMASLTHSLLVSDTSYEVGLAETSRSIPVNPDEGLHHLTAGLISLLMQGWL